MLGKRQSSRLRSSNLFLGALVFSKVLNLSSKGSPLPFSKGEEGGEGLFDTRCLGTVLELCLTAPHFNPLPAYEERRKKAHAGKLRLKTCHWLIG
jgi:hypothetical protein